MFLCACFSFVDIEVSEIRNARLVVLFGSPVLAYGLQVHFECFFYDFDDFFEGVGRGGLWSFAGVELFVVVSFEGSVVFGSSDGPA